MIQFETRLGGHVVRSTSNGPGAAWLSRLYVNQGEDATMVHGKHKTEQGARGWAARALKRATDKIAADAAARVGLTLDDLDTLTRTNVAARSFAEFVGFEGGPTGYFPTLRGLPVLADAYDAAREMQGDPRRAYRG